ncbi:hypothetical protein [Coleofasciculus chthonoplastes]
MVLNKGLIEHNLQNPDSAIACSRRVNSIVRSQPDSQQAQILFPPLRGEG